MRKVRTRTQSHIHERHALSTSFSAPVVYTRTRISARGHQFCASRSVRTHDEVCCAGSALRFPAIGFKRLKTSNSLWAEVCITCPGKNYTGIGLCLTGRSESHVSLLKIVGTGRIITVPWKRKRLEKIHAKVKGSKTSSFSRSCETVKRKAVFASSSVSETKMLCNAVISAYLCMDR